ncbi:MAG TPA: serine hydrolase domain-containing protein [Terriglobia bacterium]|nr:serine hydrolase domain-containing protein [Terriglobia bacterium]
MLGRFHLISALVILAAKLCCATETPPSSKAARIDELVSRYERYGYINGAVLVAEHGEVIYKKGIGYADMELHTPNTPQTKFGIASITKQFTAALVLQQAVEGVIRLDAKVTDYLPWYRRDTGERMMIEQLLHHTSGLPPDFESPEFSESEAASRYYGPQTFAEKFCQPNLSSEPGTKWDYSNCGYILLGLILERETGQRYGDLLRQRLLDPLGMKDSGMDRNDLMQLGGAAGYVRHAGPRYTPGPYIDRSHIFAAGAMYSTAEDLFRWSQVLSGDAVLPKEIRDQVFQPGLSNWGYGWFVTKIPPGVPGAGSTLEEMRGDMPGNYFCWILRYPEQDDVIIVLRNVYGSTERLEGNLQAILFDQEPHMPSRSPKDVAARAWQVLAAWVNSHRGLSVLVILLAAAGIWQTARRRRRIRVSNHT